MRRPSRRDLVGLARSAPCLLLIAACASPPAPVVPPAPGPIPQVDPWEAPLSEGRAALREGRNAEAIDRLGLAVARAREELGAESEPVATGYALLAQAHFQNGDAAAAAENARVALRLQEQLYGNDDPRVGATLVILGGAQLALGNLDVARHHLERALELFDAAGLMGDPDNGVILSNLARIHFQRKQYRRSERYYRRLLGIYRGTLGPDHQKVGLTLSDLGAVYFSTRRPRMAALAFQRAYRILLVELGPDDPIVVQIKRNLAAAQSRLQRQRETPRLGI